MEDTEQHQQQPEQESEPQRRIPPIGTGKLRRGFIRLRRDETCVQWGFRIIGGTDFEEPITIIKVTRESLAFKKGLRVGDVILKVCGNLVNGLTNEMTKMEILRAGNELDLVIERDLSKNVPQPLPKPRRHRAGPMEDFPPTQTVNPNLQSKSFNILREALDRMGSLSPSQEGQPIVFLGAHAPTATYAPPEPPAPVATPPAPQAPRSPQVQHVPQYVPEVQHAPQEYEPAEDEYDEYYEDTAEDDYNGYVAPEVYVPPEERNNGGFSTPPEMTNGAGYPLGNTSMEYRPHCSEEIVTEPRG